MRKKLKEELQAIGLMNKEQLNKYTGALLASFERGGTIVEIDRNDEELLKKIILFSRECRRHSLCSWDKENYGINGQFEWNGKYGFIARINIHSAFLREEYDKRRKSFPEWFEGIEKQKEILEKVRKNMAYLIRLKKQLKLPGPVQYEVGTEGPKGYGSYFFELSQDEIDDILQH